MNKHACIIVAMLIAIVIFAIIANTVKCTFCRKTKLGKTTMILGPEISICNDCSKIASNLLGGITDALTQTHDDTVAN